MADYIKKILIHLLILLFLTTPFWFFNLDIKFSSLFYNHETGWYLFNDKLVNFLYKYGTYPAIIFSLFFIIALTFRKLFKDEDIKKIAIIFLITLVFAPGLIINVLLKSYTGRPRPREIIEFNGKWEYRKVLQIGQPGRGYSFPCGHCSMGFIFCSIYFILKNRRKILANVALGGGMMFGTMIGIARIAQGAHFLSDVIWAAGITIIVSEVAYYLLFVNPKNRVSDFLINKNIPFIPAVIISVGLILMLFLFFLMSVPFYREKKVDLNFINKNTRFVFNGTGDLKINIVENNPYIYVKAAGFGLPRADYYWTLNKKEKDENVEILFNTHVKGFFKELSTDIDINLLKGENVDIIINNIKGNIDCHLPVSISKCILFTKNGDVLINIAGNIKELFVKNLKGNIRLALNKEAIVEPLAYMVLNAVDGNVEMQNHSNYLKELNDSVKDISGSKELYLRSKKTGHLYLNINARKIIINN